jgi:hypothetical protein
MILLIENKYRPYAREHFESKLLEMTGTFDQCVTAFDRDYNAIYSYLNLVNQELEGKQIEPLTAKAVYDMILECKKNANAVDSMKSTRDEYKRLLASLVKIENKLKNVG